MALTIKQAIATQVSLAYLGRPQDVGALTTFGFGLTADAIPSPTATQLAALFATTESKAVFGATATMSSVVAKSFELVGRVATSQNITDILTWANDSKLDISQLPWEIIKIAMATEQLLPQASQVVWARLSVAYQLAEDISGNATALQSLATSTTQQDAARAVISGVTSFATIATAYPATGSGTAANFVSGVASSSGQTFTLTTGVDSFTGTASNDTFTVDNTGTTKTMTVADSISGGLGTDTLRVFLANGDTGTGQPTFTGIEEVYINGGAIVAYTAVADSTSLSIDTPVVLTNATYTLSGQSVTLKSALTASAAATMTTTLANAAATTAMTVNLNGYTSSGTDVHALALTGAGLVTATLNTTSASKITSLTNTNAALATLNLTGTAAITLTDTLTALKTYSAIGTTGAVTLDISGKTPSATFSYTGSGQRDILTFGATAAGPKSTMTIDGGAGSTDRLNIKDVNTTDNTAGINKAVNFEQLGLASGTANSTYDMSLITSIQTVAIATATGAAPATPAAAAAAATNAVGVAGTTGTAGTAGILMTGLANTNTFIIEAALISTGGIGGAGSAGNGGNADTGGAGGVGGAGAIALTLTPNVDTGSNATTLTLSGVTLTSAGGVGGAGAGTNSSGGVGGAGAVTVSATSFESLTIVSNANSAGTTTANVFNAAGGAGGALAGTGANGAAGATAAGLAMGSNATVTISGAASFNPGLISGTNLTVNASGLTGALTMSSGTGNDVITGGSGVNTLTMTGGVDTINLAASTAKADVITLSSGTGTTSTSFVTIASFTNAVSTGDKLDTAIATVTINADVASGTATGVANLTAQISSGIMTFAGSAAATATLANKVTGATAAAFGGTVNDVLAFEHGGNTYVFAQVGTADAFNAGTDQLIELTGLVGVTALSATASGATTLFIA